VDGDEGPDDSGSRWVSFIWISQWKLDEDAVGLAGVVQAADKDRAPIMPRVGADHP